MGLLYAFADSLFLEEALTTSPSSVILPPDFLNQLFRFHKLSDAYLVLTYTSIFAVKFSFLFFFRVLVRRMHKMIVYWWIVVAVTTVAWAVCVISIFLPCTYFDERSSQSDSVHQFLILIDVIEWLIGHYAVSCGQKSELPKTIGFAALAIILDMITDILSMFLSFLPLCMTDFMRNSLTSL